MQDPFQLIGSSIEGRYRVDRVIGEGGFGVVYRGFHLRFEHPVAIKCLKIPGHFNEEAKEVFFQRFREEGRILLKLADAPGVPRVYDYGVITWGVHQIPYLVIEWLDGKTLEDMLATRRNSRLAGVSGGEALSLLLPAVDALAFAHQHQIAHRDIKPANLILSQTARGPTIKVLDFGIAKAMQEGETVAQSKTHTNTSFRAFTPNYAAPEQFAPKRYGASGPWTDVHALGLLLVELLTDKPANPGEDMVECLEFATSAQRPSPMGRGARISNELEAVIVRAVALAPDARYHDAGALAAALRNTPEAQRMGSATAPMLEDAPPRTERAQPISSENTRQGSGTEVFPDVVPAHTNLPSMGMTGGTGPAVSVTHGGVKVAPPPPPTSRRKKSSPVPWVAGALGVSLLAGVGYWVMTRNPKKSGKDGDDETNPTAAASAEGKPETVLAWGAYMGREAYVMGPVAEADAKGKHHVKVLKEGGKIVRVESVDPAGTVQATHVLTPLKGGGYKRIVSDGRGTLLETVEISKDGHETHLSRSGSPFIDGCARFAITFDKKGNAVERLCQDDRGHVIIDARGCPKVAREFDDRHRETSYRCQQEDGKAVSDSTGIHMRKSSYDALDRLTEVSFHDESGALLADSNGCTKNRFEYDAVGNKVTELCVGQTGMPIAIAGTALAGYARSYDAHGCVTKETFIDTAQRPVMFAGYAATSFARDQHCGEIWRDTLDLAGVLVAAGNSPARIESVLDGQGQLTEQRCLDAKRSAINCFGETASPKMGSILRFGYDEQGRVLWEKAFEPGNKPTAQRRDYPHAMLHKYDARGLLVETQYQGTGGEPAAALGNVARRVYQYDVLGAQTSFFNFGVDGAPVVDASGAHEVRRSYDDKHRLATIELRDPGGALSGKTNIRFGNVSWPDNASRLVIERDGTNVKNRFTDKNGKELRLVDCKSAETPCMR